MTCRTNAATVSPAWRRWALLAVALLLHACAEPPQQPLRLAINPWIGYDPLVLARERGWVDPADLRVIELETSGDSVHHLRNGLIDAVGLTLPEAIELAASGTDIRIVALLSLSKGADAVLARKGLRDAAMLRGSRVGLEDTALAAVMLQRLLEAGGLRRDDLHLVKLPVKDHELAMRRGELDAVITFEPVISRLRANGFDVVLDSADMPGEVVDVLVVSADVLARQPHQVQLMLDAFERGRVELLERPAQAARDLAPGVDLSADEYLAALSRIRLYAAAESRDLMRRVPEVPALALDQLGADLKAGDRMMLAPRWSLLFAGDLPAAPAGAAR